MKFYDIEGVELFSVGTWNGREITQQTLEAIKYAYDKTSDKVRVSLKLGHSEQQSLAKRLFQDEASAEDMPSLGWVENLKIKGDKLFGDFKQMPKKVFDSVKNHRYRKVSCEVYNNLEIAEEKFPKLLGAVALLGSELPGVLNLKDIFAEQKANSEIITAVGFANGNNPDTIIYESDKESLDMDELKKAQLEAEKFKALAEKAQADAEKAKNENKEQKEKYSADLKAAQEAQAKAEKDLLEAAKAKRAAEVEKFVTKLKADKVCSPSMEPLVTALLGEEQEKYSIDKEDYSKEALVGKILELASENSKVNFSNQTKDGKSQVETEKALVAKIEKYAADNNLDYIDAHREIMKQQKSEG